jgi:serine/threonine protein kinase
MRGPYFLLLTEFIDGENLHDYLQGKHLPMDEIVPIMAQLIKVLAHLHSHNIIHRDIKPGNIMIISSSNGIQIKLIDFGVSKNQAITIQPDRLGTPEYSAPEATLDARQATFKSDVYSACLVFYEMLTCQRLFGQNSLKEKKSFKDFLKAKKDDLSTKVGTQAWIIPLLRLGLQPKPKRRVNLSLFEYCFSGSDSDREYLNYLEAKNLKKCPQYFR